MDNGNIPVEVPDFTRGEWNKVKGFHHAYASPTDEAQAAADAMDFTTKLKEKVRNTGRRSIRLQRRSKLLRILNIQMRNAQKGLRHLFYFKVVKLFFNTEGFNSLSLQS